jgi:hypothetical protein
MLHLILRNQNKDIHKNEQEFTFNFYFDITNMKIPEHPWIRNFYLFQNCKNEEEEKTLLYIYYSFFLVSHNEYTIFRKLHILMESAQKKSFKSLFLSFFEHDFTLHLFIEDWISNHPHIFIS